jgi:sulfate transport system ATP-binding protein
MADQAYVELKHINKTFGDYKASDDVSFTVEKGKLIGLLGPSGSGKTTILRILAGLENADSGEIYIDGQQVNNIPASKRGIGFVFQNYALFRYKTVYDNIAFGLKIQKWQKADIKNRVDELIELVGLKGLEKRYPRQLSGGQRQRVAFARALATQPHLLLLDEPFAAIDAKVRKELRSWLRELINQVGITSIFVTHDQEEAIEVADEIIITNQGRIEQVGSPVEVYSDPQTPFVAQFLGDPVTIRDYTRFKGFRETTGGSRAIIRPEFITVTKKKEFNPYPVTTEEGVVERVSFRGNALELRVRVHEELLVATRQLGQELVKEGEKVNVFLQRLYLVDESGRQVATSINEALRQEESVVI